MVTLVYCDVALKEMFPEQLFSLLSSFISKLITVHVYTNILDVKCSLADEFIWVINSI